MVKLTQVTTKIADIGPKRPKKKMATVAKMHKLAKRCNTKKWPKIAEKGSEFRWKVPKRQKKYAADRCGTGKMCSKKPR